MKLSLIACLFFIVTSAHAGEAWLSGFSSRHSANGADLNTNNFGQGYRNKEGYAILGYRNSYNRDSLFVGREWITNGKLAVGVVAGVVTNYPNLFVTPVAIPELVYVGQRFELAVTYMPAPSARYVSATAVQLRLHL